MKYFVNWKTFKNSVIRNICIDWYIGNIHATEQIDSKKVIFTIRSAKVFYAIFYRNKTLHFSSLEIRKKLPINFN